MRISKNLLTFVRVAVSLVLLGALVWLCKPGEMWRAIRGVSMLNLAGALVLYLSSMFVVAFRWQVLLKAQGMRVGLLRLTRYYLIGFFFNNFLPSSVGGDVTRIINLASHGHSKSISFGSVFVERLIGFLAMAALSICALFFLSNVFGNAPWVTEITIGLSLVFVAITVACFAPWAERIVSRLLSRLNWRSIGEKSKHVYSAIHTYRHHAGALWQAFFISLFYQFLLGVFTYWVTYATGLGASFWLVFALMQITSMVGVVPVTLETAGTREWIYVLVLVPLGLDKSVIVAAMLLVRLLSILGSSVGGVLFLAGERDAAKREG